MNSTQILRNRWPDADTLGTDVSQDMITKAAADYPDGKWLLADARDLPADRARKNGRMLYPFKRFVSIAYI